MANLQAVSKERHAGKRWQRYSSYSFAAADAVAALVVQELPKACMSLPIGFISMEDRYVPVAVQGLAGGKNLFVAPDGRWLGGYVPASYRGYPFALANTEDGQQVLCVIEDSGLISELEGEVFFDEGGQPSKAVSDVLNFLSQVAANRQATQNICAVLQKHELIQPWLIKLQTEAGEQTVQGLFRVDEAALNALSAEALDEVRKAGALPMVYCQLLSMQHLQKLGQLAQQHAAAQASSLQTADGELDLEFLNDGGTIRFS
ncbi:SapC family protein [Parapusillimonas sp. JC17]|uniref:SapC family protein n=1 Tax=Parapusillimonas sp. JC17 TaxID=3445768 RepID=UPI003FA1853C